MKKLSITFSVADQNFLQTKSVGIFNLSMMLAETLARRTDVERLEVLTNHTLASRLRLPENVILRQCDRAVSGKLGRMYWDQWGVYTEAKKTGNDWLVLPKGFASFLRPCPLKLATYVSDIMQEYYRLKYPRYGSRLEHLYFQKAFAATMRQSDVVFTNSDFTTAEIKRLASELGWQIPLVKTIGIGFLRLESRPPEKKDSIVVLASRFPHKRTDLAIEFLSKWQQETNFCGTVDWVGSLPTGTVLPDFRHWRLHQRLPGDGYRKLISEARALVFFSEYEGFGMPPVEAVLWGTPPVFSSIPSTDEVMAEAGYAFSNSNYATFSDALNRALLTPVDLVERWAEILLGRHNPELVVDRMMKAMLEHDQ